jgi:hypothetical protein
VRSPTFGGATVSAVAIGAGFLSLFPLMSARSTVNVWV